MKESLIKGFIFFAHFLNEIIFSLNMKQTKRKEDINIVKNLRVELLCFLSPSLTAGHLFCGLTLVDNTLTQREKNCLLRQK